MISLVGGELYQWDTGRIVRVVPDENVKVHEVHFSTKRMDYAYVLKTYTVDGVTYCAIPNIILQQSNRLLCYEVCENSDGEETIANTYFDIIKRNRPEDYVYTEQEHFTIQALSNRVDKLEESSHTHSNKTELDTITEEDLETWRSPVTAAVTGGAQVGILFKELEVTTSHAEDASEWTGASSQPFKCTFRPSPGQMVYASVEGLGVPYATTAKISPTGSSIGKTIIGNYSVVNSRLKTWYNDADELPPTPNDMEAEWCFVFEDQGYDPAHYTPNLPTCTLYTKTPGVYKVTVTTLSHSIEPESVMKMYDVRPSTFAEYGTYANWKDLTKSGKYDLWEVGIKKTNYYNGVYLKEVNGTKYVYVYHSEQKEDPDNGTFITTEYTLTYDTATETVTCSDTTINPETDVIISVHLDTIISTVPDKATSLGQPTSDKVGKMLTAVDHGEGVTDNKWQSRRYEYQWVDTQQADWSVNDENDPSYVKNRIGYYAEKEAAKNTENTSVLAGVKITNLRLATNNGISVLDSLKEEIKNNIHLYYKKQRFKLKYKGDDGVSSVWEPITIGDTLIVQLGLQQIAATTFFRVKITNLSDETINITPGDIIITYPDLVKIPNNLIPNASNIGVGGVRARVISSEDLNNVYNLWYSASNVVISEDGNLLSAYNITGGSSEVFTATLLSGLISYKNGRSMIFGSADDTVSSLGLVKDDFPIIVTKYGTIYDSRPTFQYLIFTASGKKGAFDIRAGSNSTSSPITWTFEGGGNSLFIITPTYDLDTQTWSTDRTWDEVKAAAAKTENPNDYAIVWDNSLLSPNALNVTKNSSGEITGINMHWATIYPMVIDESVTPEGSGGIVPGADYMNIQYSAGSSSIEFTCAVSTGTLLPVIKAVTVSKSDDGTLTCNPTNTVVFCAGFLGMPDNNPQVICPLFYDGETYHYEFAEEDSSNIPSLYFSTTTNGIYKRLKITQGQDGAADTVVMDKEIKLIDEPLVVKLSNDRGKLYTDLNAETICNATASGRRVLTDKGTVLTHYDIASSANDKKYWILFAGSTNAQTASGGFAATEMYCNGVPGSFNGPWNQHYVADLTNPLDLTNSKVGQIAEISGVDSNGKPTSWKAVDVLTTTNTTAFTPTADYHPATKKFVEDSIKAIPVDGITIKLNEQGQLTLALSNANGVSF